MSSITTIDHDSIASAALRTYLEKLPPRGAKPCKKSNGRLEWTVLAAFIFSYTQPSTDQTAYTVISLATGLRCQPYVSLPTNGDVLHDQHAEVLARRGARLWLLNRLQHEVKGKRKQGEVALFQESEEIRGAKRWKLSEGVRLHLYVSTLPCGDASNTLLQFQRAAQDVVSAKQDALSPEDLLEFHSTDPEAGFIPAWVSGNNVGVVRGRASSLHRSSLSQGGAASLRTKPGRPDAPPSICMSCSDKIALWNTPGIGIQGSLLSSLLDPIYMSSLTLSDHPVQHILPPLPLGVATTTDEEKAKIMHQRETLKGLLAQHCRSSLSRGGRDIEVGFARSEQQFPDAKEGRIELAWSEFTSNLDTPTSTWAKMDRFKTESEPESCPNSVLFVADGVGLKGKVENLALGTKMGAPTKRPAPSAAERGALMTEPLKPPARSAVCRLNYFQAFLAAVDALHPEMRGGGKDAVLYCDAKDGAFGWGTSEYRRRKDELLGGKYDAMRRVKDFLNAAKKATAINSSSLPVQLHAGDEKNQDPGAGETSPELGYAEGSEVAFKGWLRTPATLSRFDQYGRTCIDPH